MAQATVASPVQCHSILTLLILQFMDRK